MPRIERYAVGVAEIDAMMAAGVSFERIETEIERLHAHDDVKSALWLYAWTESDRATRRRAVAEIIAGLSS
jgi:hypothetical protein